MKDIFNPTFKERYEFALKNGEKRFGSPCEHRQVRNGVCVNCLRRVVTNGVRRSLKEARE